MGVLPPFWLAYLSDPSDSGRIHSNIKQRWLNGTSSCLFFSCLYILLSVLTQLQVMACLSQMQHNPRIRFQTVLWKHWFLLQNTEKVEDSVLHWCLFSTHTISHLTLLISDACVNTGLYFFRRTSGSWGNEDVCWAHRSGQVGLNNFKCNYGVETETVLPSGLLWRTETGPPWHSWWTRTLSCAGIICILTYRNH